jgi:hypothetical protein
MKHINEKVTLTAERRQDMLVGALEGGSDYWCRIGHNAISRIGFVAPSDGRTTFIDRVWRTISANVSIPIHDVEDGTFLGWISLKRMDEGERLMQEHQPEHFADILGENDDAITADVWFQYVVLKELVYG